MKTQIRKFFSVAVAFVLLCCYSMPAFAWGPAGHRIVAMIAQQNIKPQTRTKIKQILGPNVTLASVATYADAVRDRFPHTYNNHFVDIPKTLNDYVATRDCHEDPEKGDCVLAALERFRGEALNPNESIGRRRFALKFIVHLIGDMHQPLHCSDDDDRGGNDVKVKWFGADANLHRVWDSKIIENADLSDEDFADTLLVDLTPQEINDLKRGNLLSWALEAHTLARTSAYKNTNNTELSKDKDADQQKLGSDYYDKNWAVVDKQLLRGGMRLARVLDWMFAPHTGTNTQNPFVLQP
jgi:S1/P1 Nuclease